MITTVGTDATNATANTTTNTSLTCSHGSTPAVGDLVLIEAQLIAPGSGTTNDFVLPTGWTLTGTVFETATGSLRSSVFQKVWASGDVLPTLTWPTPAQAIAVVKIRRGVDTAAPVHKSAVSPHAGTTGARTTVSITTTIDCVIEYGFSDRSGSTFTKGTASDTSLPSVLLTSSLSMASFAIPGVSPPAAYIRTATATVSTSIGASWIYALKPGAGTPPVVDAGADLTVDPNLVDIFVLNAVATDADGTISTYVWQDITNTATTVPGTTAARTIAVSRFTTSTTKTYRVTVTDNSGLTATDTIAVTFLPHNRWRKTASALIPLRRI